MTLLQKLLAQLAALRAQLLKQTRPTYLLPSVKARADAVIAEMASLGHAVTIFQGYRSFEEQDILYAQGRTTPGAIITNARGGYSFHNYGVAVDIVFVVNGNPSWDDVHPWYVLGSVGKKHGMNGEVIGHRFLIVHTCNTRPGIHLTTFEWVARIIQK